MTLAFVQRSYQGHVKYCVTFDVEYLGNRQRQRLGAKGPPIANGIQAIKYSRDRWCCEAVRSAILATAWLLVLFNITQSAYALWSCVYSECHITVCLKSQSVRNSHAYWTTFMIAVSCSANCASSVKEDVMARCDDDTDTTASAFVSCLTINRIPQAKSLQLTAPGRRNTT